MNATDIATALYNGGIINYELLMKHKSDDEGVKWEPRMAVMMAIRKKFGDRVQFDGWELVDEVIEELIADIKSV